MTRSYAEISERFYRQAIAAAQKTAHDRQAQLTLDPQLQDETYREFHRIDDKNGWSGDLRDHDGMELPFQDDSLQEQMNRVLTSEEPGSTGDTMVIHQQGDMLAREKRAFHDRHSTWLRNVCHAAARHRGHAHEGGILQRSILGYLEDLLKLAKDLR